MQHIARAARLMARLDLTVARDSLYPFLQSWQLNWLLVQPRRSPRERREHGNCDRVLVHIIPKLMILRGRRSHLGRNAWFTMSAERGG